MATRPAVERRPAPRKVIKLDLASMLDDSTLAGDRQLSALQAERPAPSIEDILQGGITSPGSVQTGPQAGANASPGAVLPESPVIAMESPGAAFNADPGKEGPGSALEEVAESLAWQEEVAKGSPGLAIELDPGATLLPTPAPGSALPGPVLSSIVLRPRLRPVRTVQDGLHAGEVDLLQFLWTTGRPTPDAHVRTIALGNALIRRQTIPGSRELGRSTVKRLIKSLAEKQCIRVRQAATVTTPAVHEIYSFQRILDHWKSRGWTHVYRDRRAVVMTSNADPGFILYPDPGPAHTPPSGPALKLVPGPTGTKSIPAPAPIMDPPPGFKPGPPLEVTDPNKPKTTPPLSAEWSRWCLERHIDSQSAREIWRASITVCPDLEPSELIFFATPKWEQLRNARNIGFPARVLATALPRHLEGEVFEEYRRMQARIREQQHLDEIRFYQDVLAHPAEFERQLVDEASAKLAEWGVERTHGAG